MCLLEILTALLIDNHNSAPNVCYSTVKSWANSTWVLYIQFTVSMYICMYYACVHGYVYMYVHVHTACTVRAYVYSVRPSLRIGYELTCPFDTPTHTTYPFHLLLHTHTTHPFHLLPHTHTTHPFHLIPPTHTTHPFHN